MEGAQERAQEGAQEGAQERAQEGAQSRQALGRHSVGAMPWRACFISNEQKLPEEILF